MKALHGVASSGRRQKVDTGAGCRSAYGPGGCPTAHGFLCGGWTEKWAVTAGFESSSRDCTAVMFSVMPLYRTCVNGGYYPGYPWEHLPSAEQFPWGRHWLDGQYVGGRLR